MRSAPRRGLISFVTPHSHVIMSKYREMGMDYMPIAFVFGVPPAYEIMANFSGLHMDMWGEMEMVGTIMDRDVEMVPCETLDLTVPAQAEIVVEGRVNLHGQIHGRRRDLALDVPPAALRELPEVEITAITMRADRPIYRNHQTCPDTDHQPLPRLCHEAVLYNRLTEIGARREGRALPDLGRGALLHPAVRLSARGLRQRRADDGDGRALAQHQDGGGGLARTPISTMPAEVYHAIATRCDPARDVIIVPQHARLALRSRPPRRSKASIRGGSSARWASTPPPSRATTPHDFERAWPRNWGKVRLEDYL